MRRIGLCALLLAALPACGAEGGEEGVVQAPLVAFDTARVQLVSGTDTIPLRVEVASSADQRAFGLMERTELPEDGGMIFTYPAEQPAEAGYWMFHTLIPLDIAYLDASGRIVAIRQMEPCPSPAPQYCQTYPPGVPYRSALEVNRGFFERHGIGLGDRVLIPEELVASATP